MDKVKVSVSTDPVKNIKDLINYAKEVAEVADYLHCDIMDGVFVPQKTIFYSEVKEINSSVTTPLDVHLMINKPGKWIKQFVKSGANILTIHFECYKSKNKLISDLKNIRKLGALSGISIKPNTKVDEIMPFLSYCDLVLVMSVEPGKSGQIFIEDTLKKIEQLNYIKQTYNLNTMIEVDGGINETNAQKNISAGANILVSGSFIYSSTNRKQSILKLKGKL